MEQESKEPLNRKLIGYFMLEDCSGGCLIVDWLYSVESLYNSSGDEKQPQIIIPIGYELDPGFPRYYELGYIPAGVYPSFDLGLEAEIPEFVDIPVYTISQGDLRTSIVVEIKERMPALKILDEEQDEELRKKTFDPELWELLAGQQHLDRHLFGYVTAIGGGILICDSTFVRMCREYHDCISNQVTVPADGEESPGFRAGVMAYIPEELSNTEFPVYGEYEGDTLKRITIEIANLN